MDCRRRGRLLVPAPELVRCSDEAERKEGSRLGRIGDVGASRTPVGAERGRLGSSSPREG